jgi:glyoxylase-like metal-dependent hydrolase (beta-lactamase superfamily II)
VIQAETPWAGGAITEVATCVLAPNPGVMTLDGTNTWVLLEPGSRDAVVIDPGPDDEVHLQAVLDGVRVRDAVVSQILLTHRHHDHSGGAARFAALTGAPVRALDPAFRLGPQGLGEGDVIDVGSLQLRVLATPGHSDDSLCFELAGLLLTGDTVLGRGTTVIAYPDGRLADYLNSLAKLQEIAVGLRLLLPGHGPVLEGPAQVLQSYLDHRIQRLEQVRTAVAAGAVTVQEVVEVVYADVSRVLWPAAELSVAAQLAYLHGDPD